MQKLTLKNKTVLVKGSAGFIGSSLVLELIRTQSPVNVVSIDNMNDYYDVSIKEWRLSEIEKCAAEHGDSSFYKRRYFGQASFYIPSESGKTIVVKGMFTCSNSSPSKYWDSVVFTSDKTFHLEYVPGSALFENIGIGANGGVSLDDDIIGKGVKLGYNELDGNIPGCYQYA